MLNPGCRSDLAKVVDAMLVHDCASRIKDAYRASSSASSRRTRPSLPDGTGRYTAVIVPTTHAVDATGDTEILHVGRRSERGRN